jgi:hypothetical protein
MKTIEVHTQAELDAALKESDALVVCVGNGMLEIYGSSQVTACGSSQVTACDSSQVTAHDSSQVRAYGSSQVTACGSSQVTAHDSSQVTANDSSQVTAYGSSQVTAHDSSQVRAYGSSQVRAHGSSRVTAYGSSQVTAHDSSQVRASKFVAVTVHGKSVKRTGGVLIRVPLIRTPKQWCEFYGVSVKGGVALVFKAVNDDYHSPHGANYAPGETPVAKDWDGGRLECGYGLHFSPRPSAALAFYPDAKRFMACPVLLKEIVVHPDGTYPEKVKAPRVYRPCYEVDIDGNPVKP